jgi:hypothetical protein
MTPSEYHLVSALRAPGPKVRYAWANPGPWSKADYDHVHEHVHVNVDVDVVVHTLVVGCLALFEDSDLSMRRQMHNTWNPSNPGKTNAYVSETDNAGRRSGPLTASARPDGSDFGYRPSGRAESSWLVFAVWL